jgi:hypothetical protein
LFSCEFEQSKLAGNIDHQAGVCSRDRAAPVAILRKSASAAAMLPRLATNIAIPLGRRRSWRVPNDQGDYIRT